MIDRKLLDELARKATDALPEGGRQFREDIEKNLHAALAGLFTRLDLVTREELEVQKEVLGRTREKIIALEAQVAQLEQALNAREEKEETDNPS